jgi:hypothetical protein
MDILEAFEDPKVFGRFFKPKDSWTNWKIFLKTVYGLPLERNEQKLYRKCTGRKALPPKEGFEEFYAIVGRRGGKSRIMSLIAVYEALYGGWEKYLDPGETATIFIIGTDKKQGKIVFNYCRALLGSFSGRVMRDQAESLLLNNSVELVIQAANFRGARGYSTAAIILDELAFFRTEESANPAEEIVNALLPSLLPEGKLIGISTPYSKFGYLYDTYKEYYGVQGEDSGILVWQADTLTMNPTYRKTTIARMRKKDPEASVAEYDAQFREDIYSYLTDEQIDDSTDQGIKQRPPVQNIKYKSFVDVSGGRSDSFSFSIAHQEDINGEVKVIVDYTYEAIPPYIVNHEVEHCCNMIKRYGIYEITGDKFGGELTTQLFKKQGIQYNDSVFNKSEIFLEFASLVNMNQVRLIEHPKLKRQLLTLERRAGRVGKDKIEKIKGAHDDIANTVAGACVNIAQDILIRPSEAELASRGARKIPKQQIGSYSRQWGKILAEAEKEMQQKLMKQRKTYQLRDEKGYYWIWYEKNGKPQLNGPHSRKHLNLPVIKVKNPLKFDPEKDVK